MSDVAVGCELEMCVFLAMPGSRWCKHHKSIMEQSLAKQADRRRKDSVSDRSLLERALPWLENYAKEFQMFAERFNSGNLKEKESQVRSLITEIKEQIEK